MSLTDKNLFSYCDNNPITRVDEGGYFWANIIIGAAVGAAISITSQLIAGESLREINWRDVGGAALSGAIASIPGLGLAASAMCGGIGNVVGGCVSGDIRTTKDVAINFISGSLANGAGYTVGKATSKLAVKAYNKLPRFAKKIKLAKIYGNKGNFRNINLRIAKNDMDLGMKLCPVKNFIYSTFSSEFVGRVSGHGLSLLPY